MTHWPRNESYTGRGFTQGSDSYRADDVAREELERERMTADDKIDRAEAWIEAQKKEREREIRHVYSDDDPNFGDYNIKPGGNHP